MWLEVDYYEGPAGEALQLDWPDLDVVSKGQMIKYESVVNPDPKFDISFFPGAKGGGWLSWLVYQDDPAPLLAIGIEYDGSGGFFFSLTP